MKIIKTILILINHTVKFMICVGGALYFLVAASLLFKDKPEPTQYVEFCLASIQNAPYFALIFNDNEISCAEAQNAIRFESVKNRFYKPATTTDSENLIN